MKYMCSEVAVSKVLEAHGVTTPPEFFKPCESLENMQSCVDSALKIAKKDDELQCGIVPKISLWDVIRRSSPENPIAIRVNQRHNPFHIPPTSDADIHTINIIGMHENGFIVYDEEDDSHRGIAYDQLRRWRHGQHAFLCRSKGLN